MLSFIGPIIAILLVSGAIWFRNRWIIDTFNSYGVYGTMAGLYLYRKFGLWHIGTSQGDSVKVIKPQEESELIVVRELGLKPGCAK